jgi:PAS domain S-box-containing protein
VRVSELVGPEPSGEVQRLRRCLGDVVAFSALAAAWSGRPPQGILDCLAEVLQRTLELDFVYASARLAPEDLPLRVVRVGGPDGRGSAELTEGIRASVERWIQISPSLRPPALEPLPGMGRASLSLLPLGTDARLGVLVAGACRPDFPSQEERVLLGVAANQAAVEIDNARLYRRATAELTERKRAEALLTDQQGVLERIARGTPLPEVLEAIARAVEARSTETLCSILLLDDTGCLRHGSAPSLPRSYNDAIDGVRIGPSVGSCGTAAFRKARVVVSDIAADPLWSDYRELALSHGFRACWSTPIMSPAGEVLGSVAMYCRGAREPTRSEEELAELATHLAGIAIDRARTEEALRQNETLLRTIIETEPECLKLLNRDGTLRHMNLAGLQMVEADSFEEIAGTCVYGLIAPEHRAAFEAMNERVFRGEAVTLQFELVGLKGTRRWMESHAVPLRDAAGEITAHLGVTRDITARRRDEEELRRRAADLTQRDREKDEFLAMLAHELRNPLAPVISAAQVVQARAGDDPLLQRQLAVITRQAQHMARLLDDLLDVSRITRGKIALRRQPVDLGAAVAQVVESQRSLLVERQHHLALSLPAGTGFVLADPTRLQQVVGNLLSNAAKYTDPGGRIEVSVAFSGPAATLRVVDNGVGIAPEFLPRIFDLFAQADRSLARTESGLGIGLTLVKQLVELHGGTVTASSAGRGRGSEFTVVWPLTAPPADAMPEASSSTAATVRRRVLIVDDNEDAADSLADLAGLWGHAVRTVHDGPAALLAAEDEPPDVVLLDISMPYMDGYQVARRLRENHPASAMTLVALTGYGQAEDRLRSQGAGFDHHLTKPVDPDLLRRLLAEPGARRLAG